jgi:WD40 repeat protein
MAVGARLTSVSEYLFRRLFKVLFRYDIFISYARRDGKGYALKLKEQLTRLDFSCFLDYDELPVGNSLNKTLKRALKKSAALVVIGTEGALKSRYVELEVGEFTATGRAIIPVDFEGTLAASPWSVIKERDLVWVDETKDALAKSTPSPPVADSIDKLFKYTRRNVRVRGQVIATAVLFVLGAAASIFLIQRQVAAANVQRRVAEAARITAQQEQGKAEAATRDAKQQEALATASAARALEKEKEASEKTEEAEKQAALARAKAEEAKQQQLRAEEQQKLASSRQLSANALSQLQIDPELSLVLAGKSADTAHTVEAEDALRKALLESHVRAVVEGQRGDVSNASFSADGEFVVVAGDNNMARIMRVADGKIVAELREQTGPMTGASFSPDGKLVVTANEARFARVWDWRANRVLLELAHPAAVDEAFFSRDGASIITIGADNAARIWDAKSGRPISPVLYGIIATEYHGNKSVRIKPFSVGGRYVFFVPAKPGDDTEPLSSAAAGKPPKERSEVVFTDGRASIWDVSAGRVVPELEAKLTHVLLADINVEQKLVVTYRGHPKGNGPTVLWDLSTGRRFAVLREEDSGDVNGLALSPDGSLLVTAGQDGAARVWKIPEEQERKPEVDVPSDNTEEQTTLNRLFTLNAHSGPLRSASFSPNGRFILTTSDDHTARVWDVKTGLEVSVLRGHSLAVLSAAFSPNGDRMITSSEDHTARVWDAGMGQGFVELQKISEPERVVFGARSNKLIFNQGERTVRVWDASSNAYLPGSWQGHMAAISATGQTIVTADQESLRVYDTTSGSVRFALGKQSGEMLSAIYSSDGSVIATAESDNFVRIRDAATGNVVKEQPFLMYKVASLRFSPGNSDLLLMTSMNNAMVWDWRAGRPPIKLPEFTMGFIEELGGGSFSPDGRLVVGPTGQLVSVWDARSGCRLKAQFLHQSTVHGAGFSQDGRFILSTDSYAAKLWQLPAGLKCEGAEVIVKEIALLDHSKTGAFAKRNALLSPDGKFIVVTSISDGPAQVHDLPTGNLKFKLGSAPTRVVAMSSNGRLIVTADDDGKARVWDATSGTLLRTLDGEPGVPLALVSFSLNDKLILTASDWRFNLVTVWDAETGKRMGQSFPGRLASFSPDGKFVVAVSGGDNARISDVNTGRTVAELKGLTGKVTHIVFSDDDQRIIAATSDRKVGVWEAVSGRQIARREFGGDIVSLAVGPGGRFVATTVKASSRSAAEGWDLQTGKTIKYEKIENIGLSPDGKLAFTVGSGPNNTKVVDVNSGAEIADLPGYLAAYSSDGKLVAAISDNVVHIVDVNSWQTRLELRGHSERVTSAVFSPDGKFLVTTAYREAAAIVWNVGSGAIETRLFGNTGYGLLRAAFSADGKSILVVGDDNTARLYRCVMCGGWDELIERARERFTIHGPTR